MSTLRTVLAPRRVVLALLLSAAVGACGNSGPTGLPGCDPRDPRQIDWTRELTSDGQVKVEPTCQRGTP